MPSGLDIDYKRALNGTMPPYAQHVVISTGRDDWGRKIEDEDGSVEGGEGINFARSLRDRLGRGGKWFDVCIRMYIGGLSRFEFSLVGIEWSDRKLIQARNPTSIA